MEIAGKDLNSVEQQRARESEGEIWVEKTERERERDGRQREGAREGEKEGERLREKREEKVVLV